MIETWADGNFPTLKNYKMIAYCSANKISKSNKGRKSGGITVYAKENIADSISNIAQKGKNCISFTFNSTAIVCIYRPPDYSVYDDRKFFEHLEDCLLDLYTGNQIVNMIVGGDFNARTGTEEGFTDLQVGTEEILNVFPSERRNLDVLTNKAGKNLINLCKNTGLRILNGRSESDPNGALTFLGNQGHSTIDYVLVQEHMLDQSVDLRVGSRLESNHMPIEVKMKSETGEISEEPKLQGETQMVRYKWDENKRAQIARLASKNLPWLQQKVNDAGNVEAHAGALLHAMKRIYRPMKVSKKPKSRNTNISVDVELDKNCAIAALQLFQRTNCKEHLEDYLVTRKKWKNTKKIDQEKKEKERVEIVQALYKGSDWKTLWKKVKCATGSASSKFSLPDDISKNQWLNHFNVLYNIEGDHSDEEWLNLSNCSSRIEQLDACITNKEIMLNLRAMKGGSAPGIDGLPTEFFKNMLGSLFPISTSCSTECWQKNYSQKIGYTP